MVLGPSLVDLNREDMCEFYQVMWIELYGHVLDFMVGCAVNELIVELIELAGEIELILDKPVVLTRWSALGKVQFGVYLM